jgi:hypothetical protein
LGTGASPISSDFTAHDREAVGIPEIQPPPLARADGNLTRLGMSKYAISDRVAGITRECSARRCSVARESDSATNNERMAPTLIDYPRFLITDMVIVYASRDNIHVVTAVNKCKETKVLGLSEEPQGYQ